MIEIKYEPELNQSAAYDGNNNIGVCQYRKGSDKWVIYHTYTVPQYGGQGIARKMVECVAKQATLMQVELSATCWYAKKVLNN